MMLKFDPLYSRGVEVKEDGLRAERTDVVRHGVAITNRPLRPSEFFEVMIVKTTLSIGVYGPLSIGVTSHKPESQIFSGSGTWSLAATGHLQEHGVKSGLYNENMKSLKVGDKVGLTVNSEKKMVLFVNGSMIGMCELTADSVYGFVVLNECLGVTIVHPLQDMSMEYCDKRPKRKKLGSCPSELPQASHSGHQEGNASISMQLDGNSTEIHQLRQQLHEAQSTITQLQKKVRSLEKKLYASQSQEGRQSQSTLEPPTLQQFMVLKWRENSERKSIRIMNTVSSRWREFGIALGFQSSDLDAIDTSCQKECVHCTEKLFGKWSQEGQNYSWDGLITALEDANFHNLVCDLKKALSLVFR